MAKNRTPKKPKVIWDTTKRQVLCCLYRFFSWKKKETLCRVFSEIFRQHLVDRGFRTNLAYPLLHTQWSGMRLEMNPVWYHVHLATEFRTDAEWNTCMDTIREAAGKLGVVLHEKTRDDIDKSKLQIFDLEKNLNGYAESILWSDQSPDSTLTFPTEQLRTRHEREYQSVTPSLPPGPSTQQVTEQQGSKNETVTPASPPQPVIRQEQDCLVNSHGKICLWCYREGAVCSEDETQSPDMMEIDTFPDNVDIARPFTPKTDSKDEERVPGVCSVDDLPPLLFRWSNFDSQGINLRTGFMAGLFKKDKKTGINVDKLTRNQYLEFFKRHVTKAKISSPFISASRLPLTPIHRALWNKQGATVAIIDTSKLNTMVVKASSLVPLTETETPHWKGYGEYLIWGEIPQAAISRMFTITNLETIAGDFSDINEFLQLDLIKSHSFCGASLYRKLAHKLKTGANHCVTLERMATLLDVPPEHVGLVAERFEEAWVSNRFGYLDQVAEDRAQDMDISNMEIGPRERCFYKGEPASDASTYTPSRSDLDHSSESEEPHQETGSASPEALARRHDTPSPPFSTQDSIDDNEPWRWGQMFEEEEMMQDERGPLNVQLFTPSTNRSQQTAETMLISPIPIDFERDISWPPSENYV